MLLRLSQFKLIILAAVLSLLGGATGLLANEPSAPENLIRSDQWRFYQSEREGEMIKEQVLADGDATLRLEHLSDGPHSHGWWRQQIKVSVGEIYNYQFEGKGRGEGGRFGINAGFELLDENGKYLGFKRLDSITNSSKEPLDDWSSFSGKFTVPPSVHSIRWRFSLDSWTPTRAAFRKARLWSDTRILQDVLDQAPASIPLYDIPLKPVSAAGTTLTPNWDIQGAEQIASATRHDVSLNGLWAIQPAVSVDKDGVDHLIAAVPPYENQWAFFKVPGYFTSEEWFHVYGDASVSWKAKDLLQKYRSVWYVRNVDLSRERSADDYVYLEGHGMRGFSLVVYWNGQRAGTLTDQRGGRVNLTAAIRAAAGRADAPVKGQLTLLALATPFERDYAYLMEGGEMPRSYDPSAVKSINGGGLTGLSLIIAPAEPAVPQEQIILEPSFREKHLNIFLGEMTNEDIASGLSYAVKITDPDGQEVLREESLIPYMHANGKLTLSVDWSNPRLWTPDDPYLYHLSLAAVRNGNVVDESLPIRFGFRELWIDGRNVMLNGQVLRLRPRKPFTPLLDEASIRRQFSFMKDMGFNLVLRSTVGDTHEMEHSAARPVENYFDIADEMGMFVVSQTPHWLSTVKDEYGEEGMSEAEQDLFFDYVARHSLYLLANHPSLLAWSGFASGANYSVGPNSLSVDPEIWGIHPLDTPGLLEDRMTDPLSRQEAERRLQATRAFIDRLKQIDPSRIIFSHFDGGSADAWGIWSYFNWTPVQEWAQWPRRWAEEGTMPIGSTEHGMPYTSSFFSHGSPDSNTEPWVSEYGTIDLGPAVYSLETEAYRNVIRDAYDPVSGGYPSKSGAHHAFGSNTLRKTKEQVAAIRATRNKDIYRAWRLYGVSFGIEPFGHYDQWWSAPAESLQHPVEVADPAIDLRTRGYKLDRWSQNGYWPEATMPSLSTEPTGEKPDKLNILGDVQFDNNRALLVYIAGSPENPVAKDHVFWSGEKLNKQVAVIWDGFSERSLELSWQVKVGDDVVVNKVSPIDIAPGEIDFLPLITDLPKVAVRTNAVIELSVRNTNSDELLSTDRFDFAVYPGNRPRLTEFAQAAQIVVFDPAGQGSQSLAALRNVGLDADVITSLEDWSQGDLLVIAKGALSAIGSEHAAKPYPQGVPVLILEQSSDALEPLGLRTYPARHRQVFPATGSPVLTGIEPSDLADWRVSTTLLPEGTAPLRPGYLYHENYNGALVPVSIETPTRGAFTPLLQCGFDLRETGLLQMDLPDGGRWMFSQLALTDAVAPVSGTVADPVASQLLTNIVSHLVVPIESTSDDSVYVLGSDADVAFLRELGAPAKSIRQVNTVADLSDGQLAFVGALDGVDLDLLRTWVNGGGTAVLAPQAQTQVYSQLNAELEVVQVTTALLPVPSNDSGIYTGLGQNNFHTRIDLPTLVFDNETSLTRVNSGAGHWVAFGFDPRMLDIEARPYLRQTERNQSRAWSQVLTHLGFPLYEPTLSLVRNSLQENFAIDLMEIGDAQIQSTPASGQADTNAWQLFGLESQRTPLGDVLLEIRFNVDGKVPAADLVADLGTVDDYDETSLNGVSLGGVTPDNTKPDEAWKTKRLYPIPAGLLKQGENTLRMHAWNRNAEKGWAVYVRGPMSIHMGNGIVSPYVGEYFRRDDPYLQRMW